MFTNHQSSCPCREATLSITIFVIFCIPFREQVPVHIPAGRYMRFSFGISVIYYHSRFVHCGIRFSSACESALWLVEMQFIASRSSFGQSARMRDYSTSRERVLRRSGLSRDLIVFSRVIECNKGSIIDGSPTGTVKEEPGCVGAMPEQSRDE